MFVKIGTKHPLYLGGKSAFQCGGNILGLRFGAAKCRNPTHAAATISDNFLEFRFDLQNVRNVDLNVNSTHATVIKDDPNSTLIMCILSFIAERIYT